MRTCWFISREMAWLCVHDIRRALGGPVTDRRDSLQSGNGTESLSIRPYGTDWCRLRTIPGLPFPFVVLRVRVHLGSSRALPPGAIPNDEARWSRSGAQDQPRRLLFNQAAV